MVLAISSVAHVEYETWERHYALLTLTAPGHADWEECGNMISGAAQGWIFYAILVITKTDGPRAKDRVHPSARQVGVHRRVFLNKCYMVDDDELIGPCRDSVTFSPSTTSPGDDLPIIRGSALALLTIEKAGSHPSCGSSCTLLTPYISNTSQTQRERSRPRWQSRTS